VGCLNTHLPPGTQILAFLGNILLHLTRNPVAAKMTAVVVSEQMKLQINDSFTVLGRGSEMNIVLTPLPGYCHIDERSKAPRPIAR
jgi:hypothetical protein